MSIRNLETSGAYIPTIDNQTNQYVVSDVSWNLNGVRSETGQITFWRIGKLVYGRISKIEYNVSSGGSSQIILGTPAGVPLFGENNEYAPNLVGNKLISVGRILDGSSYTSCYCYYDNTNLDFRVSLIDDSNFATTTNRESSVLWFQYDTAN